MANRKGVKNEGPRSQKSLRLTWTMPSWLVEVILALAAAKRTRVAAGKVFAAATEAERMAERVVERARGRVSPRHRKALDDLRSSGVLPNGFGRCPLGRNPKVILDKNGKVQPFHPRGVIE